MKVEVGQRWEWVATRRIAVIHTVNDTNALGTPEDGELEMLMALNESNEPLYPLRWRYVDTLTPVRNAAGEVVGLAKPLGTITCDVRMAPPADAAECSRCHSALQKARGDNARFCGRCGLWAA